MESGMKMNTIKKLIPNRGAQQVVSAASSGAGHTDCVLALALSDDVKYLASGGHDRSVKVWSADTCELVFSFEGHRDTVTALVFRAGSHHLYSGALDRSVKIWNVDELAYVETLFGHQDSILDIDCLAKERCITCGSRDRTLRVWKIVEESQLVFNGAHL
jgi:ribosomal RNA-processing protein 9